MQTFITTKYAVTIAGRPHLFPYRTQKLSSLALMILGGRPPGKAGRCRLFWSYGQAVKTPPFHGGNPGSIPGRITKKQWGSDESHCLYLTPIAWLRAVTRGYVRLRKVPRGKASALLAGHVPYALAAVPLPIAWLRAPVVELADTLDLGSSAKACRFESCQAHHQRHPKGCLFVLQ